MKARARRRIRRQRHSPFEYFLAALGAVILAVVALAALAPGACRMAPPAGAGAATPSR